MVELTIVLVSVSLLAIPRIRKTSWATVALYGTVGLAFLIRFIILLPNEPIALHLCSAAIGLLFSFVSVRTHPPSREKRGVSRPHYFYRAGILAFPISIATFIIIGFLLRETPHDDLLKSPASLLVKVFLLTGLYIMISFSLLYLLRLRKQNRKA